MVKKQNDSTEGLTPDTPQLRLRVLEAVLIETGHVDTAALQSLAKAFADRIDPSAAADLASLAEPGIPAAQVGGAAMLAVPKNAEGPIFREFWEAQAFALALALAERGAFTWPEWAETFGDEILRGRKARELKKDGAYYRTWLKALERVVAEKRLGERSSDAP